MKRDVIRRRRTTSFRMIACVHHRRDSGGGWPGSDGHPGGTSDRRGRTRREWERGASECGRRPSGRTACGGSSRHVDGKVTDVANPVDDEIQPSGGAIGAPRPGWK